MGLDAGFSKPDALARVARALLDVEIGERVPTVQELQSMVGVGSGTVIKALRVLQESGAVAIEARGHLGTTVRDRHVGRLWNAARLGNLDMVLTPPGPIEQHGLAAAIRVAMQELEISVNLRFVPGAARRLRELGDGRARAVVTSKAAHALHRSDLPAVHTIDLGPWTYYAQDSLVVVQRSKLPSARKHRVGIDRSSDDHRLLTEAEFGDHKNIEFVPCSFIEGPALILEGRLDAVVWHRLPALIPPELAGLKIRPLAASKDNAELQRLSTAVIVVNAHDKPTLGAVRAITPELVRIRQERLAESVGDSSLLCEALWLD